MPFSENYVDCAVLIHNQNGELLSKTKVTDYDRKNKMIKVEQMPTPGNNEILKLFILSQPSPCEYKGRVVRIGRDKEIALFGGEEKELRQAVRYKVNFPAQIIGVVEQGELKPAKPPIDIKIIDISTHGFKFFDKMHDWHDGDLLHVQLLMGETHKEWVVKVVRLNSIDDAEIEYGCRFLLVS